MWARFRSARISCAWWRPSRALRPDGGWCWRDPSGFGRGRRFASASQPAPRASRIVVTGYVSPEELAAMVCPRARSSLFLRWTKASACRCWRPWRPGVPVMTSNRSALPEVAGDAALLVDPEDTEALPEALRQTCTDDADLRGAIWRAGAGRGHRTSPGKKPSRETWEVYRGRASGELLQRLRFSSSTAIFRARRKRWSWEVNLILPVASKCVWALRRLGTARPPPLRRFRRFG